MGTFKKAGAPWFSLATAVGFGGPKVHQITGFTDLSGTPSNEA